jgi:hypothetical protein
VEFNSIISKPDIQHLACECADAGLAPKKERSVTVKLHTHPRADLALPLLITHLDVRQLDLTLCCHMLPPVTRLY